MDHRKQSSRRPKRQPKGLDDANYWDCSVCTYRNTAEAFKCLMCDIRKGTSTRKPKINPNIVATQVAQIPITSSTVTNSTATTSFSPPPSSPTSSSSSSSSSILHSKSSSPVNNLYQNETNKSKKVPSSSSSTSQKKDSLTTNTSINNSNKVSDKTIDKKKRLLKKRQFPPRLKNIDRSSGQTREITVNSVTVIITEYKAKKSLSTDSFTDTNTSLITANR